DAHRRRAGDGWEQVVGDGDGEGEAALLGVGVRRGGDVVAAPAVGHHRACVGGVVAPGDGGGEVGGCLVALPRRVAERRYGEPRRRRAALQGPARRRHRRRRDLLVGDGGHRGNHSYADVVEVEEAGVVAEGELDLRGRRGGGEGEAVRNVPVGRVVGHAEDGGPTHRGGEVVGGAAVAF